MRLQLPIDPNSKDLYVKCGDGILLWSVHIYSELKACFSIFLASKMCTLFMVYRYFIA